MRCARSYRKITLANENAQQNVVYTPLRIPSSGKSGEWGPRFVARFKIARSFACRRKMG